MPSPLYKAAAIVGAAEANEIGFLQTPVTSLQLHIEAIHNVCAQTGIPVSRIDGVFSTGWSTELCEHLGIHPKYIDTTAVGGCSFEMHVHHALALAHHFFHRHRFLRHRHLSRFDPGQVKDFVDQLQQMPAGLQNLADAFLLAGRGRRGVGLHHLGKAENGVERRSQLVTHAGQEIRFGAVCLFRHHLGALQLNVLFLQHLVQPLALGNVARGGEHALQLAVAVVERGGVVGDDRFPAVARARSVRSRRPSSGSAPA